jgi:hypothetical protein
VWNGEAARSLGAHAKGGEYYCIAEEKYDEYNGLAVDTRRNWNIEQVWSEYEAAYDQLKLLVETMPVEKWNIEMLYPWNERGTIQNLIEVMMPTRDKAMCNALLMCVHMGGREKGRGIGTRKGAKEMRKARKGHGGG